MKRSRNSRNSREKSVTFKEETNTVSPDISANFLTECEDEFKQNPSNIISRNAIVAIGSMIATTDSTRLNSIDHVFMNSIKKRHLKSTNQGHSGRCWMFAGLNIFRHSVIAALNLETFEFSETYLFFWDKLERSNSYLRWFIDHPEITQTDREFDFMVEDFTGDGGWWNTFANLVTKYGVVPKSAMKETFQSDSSDDMNKIIDERLQATANYIMSHKHLPHEELLNIKNDTVKQIYSILVKFLGEPPKQFRWSYSDDEGVSNIIAGLEPKKFMKMVIPDVNLHDFIVLAHVPDNLDYNKLYEIKYTNNVYEGKTCTFINLPIEELSKYAVKSILSGMPVWFGSDVSQDFNPYHSTLDDKLSNEDIVFGKKHNFSKGDRILFRNTQANHAMTLTGVNFSSNGKPESWQVENSWGYFDNETPGEDGFLFMSHSWFNKNVMQIVVHKNYLSRTVKKILKQTPEIIDPWDCIAPALKIKSVNPPKQYQKKRKLSNVSQDLS